MSDYEKAIKERLEAINDFLQFEPIKNETELTDIMTLGEYWDDPEVVVKSLDQHPQFEARYIGLRRTCEIAKNRSKAKLDYFDAQMKEWIAEKVFKTNCESGMTANNAKPTGPTINNKYLVDIVEGDPQDKREAGDGLTIGECVKQYRVLAEEFGLAEEAFFTVKIITDALKSRKDMLISMAALLGRLVDNKLIILTPRHKRKKKEGVEDADGFK